jgi:hypothetical protein
MHHQNLSQELPICQQIKVVWKIPDISAIDNIFLFILQTFTLQKISKEETGS